MTIKSFNISPTYNNVQYTGIVYPLGERKFDIELNDQRLTIELTDKGWKGELEPDFLRALGIHILYCVSIIEREMKVSKK